jgi:mono/diheme cytochrome c family protein
MMSRWIHALLGAAVTVVWLSRALAAIGSAAHTPDGWRIPDAAAAERSPLTVSAGDLARGQALFRGKCQSCHGADGSGHGPDSDPSHPAGDLTDGRAAFRNPDGVLFHKIWNGRAKPKMPAMKLDLTSDDAWRLVAYVKTLRR